MNTIFLLLIRKYLQRMRETDTHDNSEFRRSSVSLLMLAKIFDDRKINVNVTIEMLITWEQDHSIDIHYKHRRLH